MKNVSLDTNIQLALYFVSDTLGLIGLLTSKVLVLGEGATSTIRLHLLGTKGNRNQ